MLLSEKVQYILTFCSFAVSWSVPQHHCAAWLRPTDGDQIEIYTLFITRLYFPLNNLSTNAKHINNFLSSFIVEVINRCIQDVLNSPLFCICNFLKTKILKNIFTKKVMENAIHISLFKMASYKDDILSNT